MDSGNELEVQDYPGDAEFASDDKLAKKSARKGFFKKNRAWLIPVVVILLALGGFFAYQKFFKKSPAAKVVYQYETVKLGTLTNTISGTGNIAVRHEVDVNASTSGTVTSVKVAVGDKVTKGQTLFTLDGTDVEAKIKSASASVISAEQQVANARSSLTMAKAKVSSLKAEKNSSNPGTTAPTSSDITAAEQAVTAAQLGLSAANAQLTSVQSDYNDAVGARSDLKVKAPCAGTIWTVAIAKGDAISAGSSSGTGSSASGGSDSSRTQSGASTTGSTSSSSSTSSSASMTIAKESVLGVELAINETDVTSIKKGQTASVSFNAIGNKTFTGKVDEVANEGTTSSNVVSYNVWIVLDKADSQLKSGMTAAADVAVSKEANVLLVSNAAVKGSGSNQYVLIEKTGTTSPTRVRVTTGTRGDSQTVIKSGVTAGETIVTQAITTSSSGTTTSILGSFGGSGAGAQSFNHDGANGGFRPSGSGMPGGN